MPSGFYISGIKILVEEIPSEHGHSRGVEDQNKEKRMIACQAITLFGVISG